MMGLIQAPAQRWLLGTLLPATPITISGTGTDVVLSDVVNELDYGLLPPFADIKFFVTYTHVRSGGSGSSYAEVELATWNTELGASASADMTTKYTGRQAATALPRTRRLVIAPPVFQAAFAGANDRVVFRFRAWGSDADTEWSLTAGQAGFLYLPL